MRPIESGRSRPGMSSDRCRGGGPAGMAGVASLVAIVCQERPDSLLLLSFGGLLYERC